ncbi:MAG: hypothetical protein ACFFAS_04295 [Promethearchaeota archaeon]
MRNHIFDCIGGNEWHFSDEIFKKLTGRNISSQYYPEIPVSIRKIPNLLSKKNLYIIHWGRPTFKDLDCNYLLHVHDNDIIDFVVSTSSGNTVEGMARAIQNYNNNRGKEIKAILLVPALSSFKVARSAIHGNDSVKLIVLENSTLDSIRKFASDLVRKLSENNRVVIADADLKTAAYSQMGLLLDKSNLLSEDTCFVQTVSGGVGPTGLIEAARKLNAKPELLLVQTTNGPSSPTIDALEAHSKGEDPIQLLERGKYETPSFETTLGSTKPIYSVKKFIEWRDEGGLILGVRVSENELYGKREVVLQSLLEIGIYPNEDLGLRYFNLERSGFLAFVGLLKSVKNINAENIVINYTGRYVDPLVAFPEVAKPHISFDPREKINLLLEKLIW